MRFCASVLPVPSCFARSPHAAAISPGIMMAARLLIIANFILIFPDFVASRLIVAGIEDGAIANPGTLAKIHVTQVTVGSIRHITGGPLKNCCILVVDENANARKLAVETL